jgi:thiol-disulfide isomerase/thioredoxin
MFFALLFVTLTVPSLLAETVESLADAKTVGEVKQILQQEVQNLVKPDGTKPDYATVGNLILEASKRIGEFAQSDEEKAEAAMAKYQGYQLLVRHYSEKGEEVSEYEKQIAAALSEMKKYPKSGSQARLHDFNSFKEKVRKTVRSGNTGDSVDDRTFDSIVEETQQWTWNFKEDGARRVTLPYIFLVEVFIDEPVMIKKIAEKWTRFVHSDAVNEMKLEIQEAVRKVAETLGRRLTGSDPKLYGRTLEDKPFQWDSLKGKVVVINFTASWCGPCKQILPELKECYEKYHQQGFEIVSVYVWDELDASRQDVEKQAIPWLTISEELTEKAGEPRQSGEFAIQGIPTTLLVDKAGKIVLAHSVWNHCLVRVSELLKE